MARKSAEAERGNEAQPGHGETTEHSPLLVKSSDDKSHREHESAVSADTQPESSSREFASVLAWLLIGRIYHG